MLSMQMGGTALNNGLVGVCAVWLVHKAHYWSLFSVIAMDEPGLQFRDQWLTAFPWLYFEEGKMFCTRYAHPRKEYLHPI